MIFMNSGVWAPSRRSTNSYNPLINKDKIFPIMPFIGEARPMHGTRTEAGVGQARPCAAAIGLTADRRGGGAENRAPLEPHIFQSPHKS